MYENDVEEQVESISNMEKNKNKVKQEEEEVDDGSRTKTASYNFPMNRINRIIKAEYDTRITQEAVFVINKASEKFLELLAKEAFECSFIDKKNQISYDHLSSAVCKGTKFDFLSDFVPEKVKVEDALKEKVD